MTRTLRFGTVDLDPAHERVHGHDFEDDQTLVPSGRFAHGTPWPRELIDERDALDHALTTPVPREELDPAEAAPLPPLELPLPPLEIEMEADLGTRTLMGVGARAVRAVAKAGQVEARAARREPRATPDALYSHEASGSMPPRSGNPTLPRVIVAPAAFTETSSRRTRAEGSGPVMGARPIQSLHLPPEERRHTPEAPALRPAPVATVIASADAEVVRRPRATRAKASRSAGSSLARALGVALLALAVMALVAYVATAVFFVFSERWVAPAVISPSDDRVLALRTSLAAQQQQRDRLAAELEEATRAIAAQPDPASEPARQAGAHGKILEASIARQDEIIAGLAGSPYLRALSARASVALVPYDHLEHAAPGTPVLACRVAMVVCREVGRVIAVLPGEVSFKHPRREKMMRGQMIELELTEPAAARKDLLFLGSAPLLL
jgi:hypothetical protein